MNKGAILPLFYLPPIEYFSHLISHSEILLEQHEHFPKQTYRNRATIQSPNGRLDLIVPVIRGSKLHTPVKDVKISYDYNWQRLHWMSLQTSYRSTVYFEFYEHDFVKLYEKRWNFLFDLNTEILGMLLRLLKLNPSLDYTLAYKKECPELLDLRDTIHPKSYSSYSAKPYFQVFEERNGFLPNLSVVDLLFSQGPQSAVFFFNMSKIRRIRIKPRRNVETYTSPDAVLPHVNTNETRITLYSYNAEKYIVEEIDTVEQLDKQLKAHRRLTHWIDVRGGVKPGFLDYLEAEFGVHKLVLEDIVHTYQRPKIDEYDGYLFATSRMLYLNAELEIENDQISFLLLPDILISFQESCTDCINNVIPVLERGKGIIRTAGSSYMMYSLMDVVIDNYFALIFKLGDELETIEELLYRKPDKSIMFKTQEVKRAMIMVRRAAWPERDKLNDMLRSESSLINKETKTFVKDAYDHCMQVIDLVESYKDITTSLIDMNLSIVSNRMNEIMKVLTIISSIFIPLTFIAGVYGMNFAYQDPETGKVLHKNMPELYAENGYVYTIAAMFIISVLQVIWFWRKGWLKS